MDPHGHVTPSDHAGNPVDVGELLWSSQETKWAGFPLVVHRLHEHVVVRDAVQEIPMVALCLDGQARMQAETSHRDKRALSTAGAAVISGRSLEYNSFSWDGSTRVLTVGMDTRCIAGASDEDRFSPVFMPMHAFLIHDPQISALMQNMLAEAQAGCPAGAIYGESLSLTLASYVAGRYAAPEGPSSGRPTLTRSQLRLVLEYVHAHLADDISLSDLAGLARLSVSHFSQLFRNTCAASPHQYVIRQRVTEALHLLRLGRMSLAEIAQQTGFADQSHMSRVVKRAIKTTPRRYQLSHRDWEEPG